MSMRYAGGAAGTSVPLGQLADFAGRFEGSRVSGVEI
jgi:hypothetical protein